MITRDRVHVTPVVVDVWYTQRRLSGAFVALLKKRGGGSVADVKYYLNNCRRGTKLRKLLYFNYALELTKILMQ